MKYIDSDSRRAERKAARRESRMRVIGCFGERGRG
jgi:hypothetical protein